MTYTDRQKRVLGRMLHIYCRAVHKPKTGATPSLCGECRALYEYAVRRLEKCPHGHGRKSCRKCGIHCYAPAEREAIRAVMRYAGPRMLLYHPLDALRHLCSEL